MAADSQKNRQPFAVFLRRDKMFHQEINCRKVQKCGYNINQDEVDMLIFMMLGEHGNQAADTAAQNRQKIEVFFGDTPSLFDGSFFIHNHRKV